MTHSVATASNAALAPGTSTVARAARTTGTSFAVAHAAAVKDSDAKDTKAAASSSSDAPKGERTQKVDGHKYVEIVSGPRNGMFINNTGGKRDGDAFLIVKRNGREFHIYGTGEDRAVYEVGRKRDDAASGSNGTTGTGTTPTTATTPATGTTGTGVSTPATTG